jgi:hypothetical protein
MDKVKYAGLILNKNSGIPNKYKNYLKNEWTFISDESEDDIMLFYEFNQINEKIDPEFIQWLRTLHPDNYGLFIDFKSKPEILLGNLAESAIWFGQTLGTYAEIFSKYPNDDEYEYLD